MQSRPTGCCKFQPGGWISAHWNMPAALLFMPAAESAANIKASSTSGLTHPEHANAAALLPGSLTLAAPLSGSLSAHPQRAGITRPNAAHGLVGARSSMPASTAFAFFTAVVFSESESAGSSATTAPASSVSKTHIASPDFAISACTAIISLRSATLNSPGCICKLCEPSAGSCDGAAKRPAGAGRPAGEGRRADGELHGERSDPGDEARKDSQYSSSASFCATNASGVGRTFGGDVSFAIVLSPMYGISLPGGTVGRIPR
mmetsp:Transcript_37907/g.86023  ORF Transcript_37907/g.86023 Transcript_37907/m.86023 type:complete len:261 (+) Transcript_37907:256-1038(+)